MDRDNMRDNGVRRLDVHCWLCHHEAVFDVDEYPDHVIVQSFATRMVCRHHRRRRAAVLARGAEAIDDGWPALTGFKPQ